MKRRCQWQDKGQWQAQGWAPDMLRTLCLRALSSYRGMRHDALVLGPVDSQRPERAAALRQALCAMDAETSDWTDPPPLRQRPILAQPFPIGTGLGQTFEDHRKGRVAPGTKSIQKAKRHLCLHPLQLDPCRPTVRRAMKRNYSGSIRFGRKSIQMVNTAPQGR